jgi:hypothetical protein
MCFVPASRLAAHQHLAEVFRRYMADVLAALVEVKP